MIENDDKNRFSDAKQEVKIEDLPVKESKQAEVTGGGGCGATVDLYSTK